ncbi:MAG: caspase family protein [Bradymonadales bacterium]|nr:caspase family protein [Bradymonadales bacterium]
MDGKLAPGWLCDYPVATMRSYQAIQLILFGVWIGCGGAAVVKPDVAETPAVVPPAAQIGEIPLLPLDRGSLMGDLGPCDALDEDGRYYDSYAVELTQGQWVRFWAVSTILDPMLRVNGPSDFLLENDDLVPGTLIPMIQFEAPESGMYTIRLTGYQVGQTGAYTLGALPLTPAAEPQRMGLGSTLEGMTSAGGGGPGLRTGANHWFVARQGERVTLRLTSAVFDTVAVLFGPDGQVWINDDANDVGEDGTERTLDSTLVVFAPTSGLYHFVVTAYADTGGGTYRIRSRVRPPVILQEGEQVPSMGYAGQDGLGRIHGLFVGISAYQSMGNLYGCADDARFLAQAFRERGLQSAGQQTVLTDGAATRGAFLQAAQTLSRKAGPDDVLVIFFSGHGNNPAVSTGDSVEIDGTDESIVLVDGEVTDNELADILRQSTAGLALVAFDSCHSGGFAQDLAPIPHVVGLFSSDEDILSDTAESLGAGGYLSYYLRRGVLGEADTKPQDGSLLVGELIDYLYRGFIASHDKMNPPGSDSPDQRLVIQRSSVGWDQLLWLYPRKPDGSLPPVPDLPLRTPQPQPSVVPERPTTCAP